MRFSIYRYNPDLQKKPYMQSYTLDVGSDKDMMVLDALLLLKKQDETLSFRRSCGEGVCGSDGMNINGKNRLACITSISSLKTDHIKIRPLPGYPVIRDLIIDMNQFYKHYENVEPYLKTASATPSKERLQSPEQRAKLDGLYECILCACCSTSCPSHWWNPDKFAGPAALLQANRFISDSRDEATDERLSKMDDAFTLFRCRGVMNCVDACPKGLNPTKAISEIRTELLNKGV